MSPAQEGERQHASPATTPCQGYFILVLTAEHWSHIKVSTTQQQARGDHKHWAFFMEDIPLLSPDTHTYTHTHLTAISEKQPASQLRQCGSLWRENRNHIPGLPELHRGCSGAASHSPPMGPCCSWALVALLRGRVRLQIRCHSTNLFIVRGGCFLVAMAAQGHQGLQPSQSQAKAARGVGVRPKGHC